MNKCIIVIWNLYKKTNVGSKLIFLFSLHFLRATGFYVALNTTYFTKTLQIRKSYQYLPMSTLMFLKFKKHFLVCKI
jgi:hypothetical protein